MERILSVRCVDQHLQKHAEWLCDQRGKEVVLTVFTVLALGRCTRWDVVALTPSGRPRWTLL